MKATKLIKAFMPYAINAALFEWCGKAAKSDKTASVIEHFIAKDPGDHEWSNMGLIAPLEAGRIVHDLDGLARMLMFQFSERKLPASVRDEEVDKRYKDMSIREGRPLNKKEFAQLRDDVESALLPQAFITRKMVPVLVFKDRIFICTSSVSMAEKIFGHLARMCDTRKIAFVFGEIETVATPGFLLGQIARNGVEYVNEDDGENDAIALHAGAAAVFQGEDKRAIRVKNRDLSSEELQQVMSTGTYATTELSITLKVGGDEICTFTLTDKFIFKGVKLSDVTMAGIGTDADDLHATYWLLAKELSNVVSSVTDALNEGQADESKADEAEEL
jgi:DNA recombination-dependent growth factor C